MRKRGSKSESCWQRNREIMETYVGLLNTTKGQIILDTLLERVSLSPCSRFWIGEERAAIVLSYMFRTGEPPASGGKKREMYLEMYRRAQIERQKHPDKSITAIAWDVVHSKAPQFYVLPTSLKVIICKTRKSWYKEKERKMHRS